ncbi:MAG TPA: nitronate monooxygenase [Chthonomonadaceae bacterium]|nr:nitronate monooxygenase [Chthonomonadaceae bacterium]
MPALPFGLRYPIAQAPTGSVAGPELAAAVSAAGALGAMALTWTPPETAAEYVRQVRAATDHPFLVNFALAFPPTSLTAVLEAGAPIVSFSWGDPAPYLSPVRAAGAAIGMQVASVAGARHAVTLGVDFLVCQGIEAGGHVQSTTPLEELLPRVVAAAEGRPVFAAGGIADGAGIARALSLGAAAAMLGTRFVATQESRAHPEYKRRLMEAAGSDTALTVCFDGGWPYAAHRVLRNNTLERWEALGCPPPGQRPGEGETVATAASGEPILRYEDTAPRAGMTGQVLDMALYAGTGCGVITDVPPAAALVERLVREYEQALIASARLGRR